MNTFDLTEANDVANNIVRMLKREGHSAAVKLGKTRVSVRVSGRRQQLGIRPHKSIVKISCPGFSEKLTPPNGEFQESRGY